MGTQTADPTAELADPSGDYELTVTVEFALNDYTDGIARQRVVQGWYGVCGGRKDGVGRLAVTPIVGQEENAAGEPEDVDGETVLDLAGLEAAAAPLALLRALLSGGTA